MGALEGLHHTGTGFFLITIVKDVYYFSQSIAREKQKIITAASHNGNIINVTM